MVPVWWPARAHGRVPQQHELELVEQHWQSERHDEHQPEQHGRRCRQSGAALQDEPVHTRTHAVHHRQGPSVHVRTVSRMGIGIAVLY